VLIGACKEREKKEIEGDTIIIITICGQSEIDVSKRGE
jgi:hypothetical protein